MLERRAGGVGLAGCAGTAVRAHAWGSRRAGAAGRVPGRVAQCVRGRRAASSLLGKARGGRTGWCAEQERRRGAGRGSAAERRSGAEREEGPSARGRRKEREKRKEKKKMGKRKEREKKKKEGRGKWRERKGGIRGVVYGWSATRASRAEEDGTTGVRD